MKQNLAAIVIFFLSPHGPLIAPPSFLTPDENTIEKLHLRLDEKQKQVNELKRERQRLRKVLSLPLIVRIGQALQRYGFLVSENPWFGGVDPVHAAGSAHYPPCSCAVDVNWPDAATEPAHLDLLATALRTRFPALTIYWSVPGHYTHLHADTRAMGPSA